MSDISKLKRRSMDQGVQKLVEEIDKTQQGGSDAYKDDRYWSLTVDNQGTGHAVIRFLPPVDGEDVPFVRIYDHGFQGPGGWYIEKSLTTIGQADPVSEANSELWNTEVEENKNIARKRKRRLSYHVNIYVIDDPANPENNGKVFLFKIGKKIFDKIMEAAKPEFEDQKPFDAFCFWTGANFRLKARQKDGYRNYDSSSFDVPGPLFMKDDGSPDDDAMEVVWRKQHPLQPLIAPDQFKSYDELKKRFEQVWFGNKSGSTKSAEEQMSVANKFQSNQSNSAGGEGTTATKSASNGGGGDSETKTKGSEENENSGTSALKFFKQLADDED